MPSRYLVLIVAILACATILVVPFESPAAVPASNVREITIKATQFAFDPPIVRINRGDRVALTVQATDVVHGLHLDGYNVNLRAVPGLPQRAEFVADRTGKFRFRCSVSCGNLHPFMIGELVVTPNDLYWRAIGLTVIVVAATLAWLRLGRASTSEYD